MFKKNTFYIFARTLANILIIGGIFIAFISFWPVIKEESLFYFRNFRGITYSLDKGLQEEKFSPFGLLVNGPTPLKVYPVSPDFGIVIEKIGVNAPVVANVNVARYSEYFEALKNGVAHAQGTVRPGEVGNTYLFAHSALDFWNFGRYAMVFTMLHKLEIGDRIVLFYEGRRYDYEVLQKEIFKSFDTTPLNRDYTEPFLTLQTCDPPGTALNRLIVTARLVQR